MPKLAPPRRRRRLITKPRRRLNPIARVKRVYRRKRPSSPPKTKFVRKRPLIRRRPSRHWRRRTVRVIDRRPLWWEPTRVIVHDDRREPVPNGWLPRRIIPAARRALRRIGLARPFWSKRLTKVHPRLIRFINHFYQVDGFGQVVRLYFGGRYQRAAARLLLRLARQLARRHGHPATNMRFYQSVTFAPDGLPITAVFLVHDTVHYVVLPWSQLHMKAMQRLFSRSASQFDQPAQVRFVFDGRSLPLSRSVLVRRLQNSLRSNRPYLRRWLSSLPELIMVL